MQELTRRNMDMKRFKKMRSLVVEKITKLVDLTDDQSKKDLAVLRDALNTGNFTKAYAAGLIDMTPTTDAAKLSEPEKKRERLERYDAKEMSDEEVVEKIEELISKGYTKTKIAVCFNKSDAWVYLKLKHHKENQESEQEQSKEDQPGLQPSDQPAESEVPVKEDQEPITLAAKDKPKIVDALNIPSAGNADHDEPLKQIESLQAEVKSLQKEADHWMNMYNSQSETTKLIAAQRDDYKEISISKQKKLSDSNENIVQVMSERDDWKKRALHHERNYYQAADHIEHLESKLNAALTTLKLMIFKQESELMDEVEKRTQP